MLNIKKLNLTLKNKKKPNFIWCLFFFICFLLITYFTIPKLLNFSIDSIIENLKKNNNINANNISKVDYKIFPTPRLSISNSNLMIGAGAIEVINGKLEIILNISQIFNSKKISYKKILIYKGHLKINLDKTDQLLNTIYKNKKKIIFKKNNIIFFKKDKIFFNIKDAKTVIKKIGTKKELTIKGYFLNNKIFIKLDSSLNYKNNLILKIPSLDIAAKVFFEKNNSNIVNGILNLEVFNNLLKFNFVKRDNIELINGFIRSKLLISSFEGEVFYKPNFYTELDFKPSSLNVKKLFSIVQKKYFSENINDLSFAKKINGVFNFKSKFEGRIINSNGEVLFKNFKVGKNKSFHFNARIFELGEKSKIKFNLIKTIKYKKNLSKKIEIIGFLIPSKSKIIFEKLFLDENLFSVEQTKEYEKMFQDDIIQNSLANIFSESKVEKFLKNVF